VLIESKAAVITTDCFSRTPALHATMWGYPWCLQVLINAKADVNTPDEDLSTPVLLACIQDRLDYLQLLVDAKADLNATSAYDGSNSISQAMYIFAEDECADGHQRAPGIPFSVLSCDTDINNEANVSEYLSQATVNTYIDEYKQIHAFIDEYHTVTEYALSEDAVVDTRVGRSDYGLYHEPLERILEYLGLSMKKNQTVNTSIDGIAVMRALIPGHPTNANHWYQLYQRTTHCSSCRTQLTEPNKCPCRSTTRSIYSRCL
jgi:hypothetical protein